jgi:hypothetical protein
VEENMKKAAFIVLSALMIAPAVDTAQAEVCYRLGPFIDVLRLAETDFVDASVGGSHTLVVGNWIAHGAYTLPVVGSFELDLGSTSVKRLAVHGVNKPGGGSGFSDCTLDGILGGAWDLACDGRKAGFFNNSGSPLTPVSCAGLPPSNVVVPGTTALPR